MSNKPNIFILSGSLREHSSTHAVIAVAKARLQESAVVVEYSVGLLPHFNDSKNPPEEVTRFRTALSNADGVLICTPEYAFGVPGSLKNALDWTVSSGELVNKATAVIVASTGGDKAFASLMQTLSALSANVPDDAKLLISFIRAKMDNNGAIIDAQIISSIRDTVDALLRTAECSGASGISMYH